MTAKAVCSKGLKLLKTYWLLSLVHLQLGSHFTSKVATTHTHTHTTTGSKVNYESKTTSQNRKPCSTIRFWF